MYQNTLARWNGHWISEGDTVVIVDENGGTFAFPNHDVALPFFAKEMRGGAENLEYGTVTVPRDNMTWDQIAGYAASHGMDKYLYRAEVNDRPVHRYRSCPDRNQNDPVIGRMDEEQHKVTCPTCCEILAAMMREV